MACNEIHKYDINTTFLITVQDCTGVIDVAEASGSFIFTKPDCSNISRDINLYTDGTDGKLFYTWQSGELDQVGIWKSQLHLQFPSGTWYSDITTFKVYDNLI